MAESKSKAPVSKAKKAATKKGAASVLRGEVQKTASAAVRRAEELLDLIDRRKQTITESFYEVGKALQELLKKKLYAALGYASFEAMLQGRNVFGATQAWKLIEVVASTPLKTALEVGPEKAFALARYAAATPELDTPQSLVESGAKIGKEAAGKASLRAIEDAARKARAKAQSKKGAKADPKAREADRAASRGRAWLKARGVKNGEVAPRRTKDGYRLRIRMELPLEAALALFDKG